MFGTTLLDHEGRAVGHVPPVDQDIEGHIIMHIDRMMAITSVFFRHVVERLVTTRGLDANRVLEFIGDSPVLRPNNGLSSKPASGPTSPEIGSLRSTCSSHRSNTRSVRSSDC